MNLILIIALALIFVDGVHNQFISPCPRLFNYESQNNESDRWYGQITLTNDAELSGVWLRLIFDKESIQLGDWFGEVVKKSDNEYLIQNRHFKLLVNAPLKIRFFIKYNLTESPPQLIKIKLNAKTICPERETTTEAAPSFSQLTTSSELSTTVVPLAVNQSNVAVPGTTYVRPGGGFRPIQNIEDDDYFQGDFALLMKHQKNTILDSSCGTVVKPPKPLVTHGQVTEVTHEGEFPWHAALYHSRNVDLIYVCGASLVTKYHLITIAHCVSHRKSQTTLTPGMLVVYLGKFYLKSWSNPGIQDRKVERIMVHPNYNARTFSNDIALLTLVAPATITHYVRPVCLWEEQVKLDVVVGKQGIVVGWGYDETGKVTDELKKAHITVVSQETCIYSFPDFYSRFTSEKTFCAGFKKGTALCNGDAGGGIVFPKSGSNSHNPVWQLRGVVSISVGQDQFKCDSMHYDVFTDVAKYLDWIKSTIAL